MERPTLYHGSVADIDTFRPRDGVNNAFQNYHGTLATQVRPLAMMFALKVKEGEDPLGGKKDERGVDFQDFMICGHVVNGTPVTIIRDRVKYLEALERVGGGGYLYTVPNESFEKVIREDGRDSREWLSTSQELKPLERERVTLESAMHAGAQILFMPDGKNFDDFERAFRPRQKEMTEGDQHAALLREMVKAGVLIDENARRGIPNALQLTEPKMQQQAQQQQAQHLGRWTSDPHNQLGRGAGTGWARNTQS
jgi:hypothetical protein